MKRSLVLNAYAKVNLALDITGLLPDGYHSVEILTQSIDLCDIVNVTVKSATSLNVTCSSDSPEIPRDDKNIVVKAARLLAEKYGIRDSIVFFIKKRIPHAAGLGGGSSDAAAALHALNSIYGLDLTNDELCQTGIAIGADVPFCIYGGTAVCRGVGEMLTQLDAPAGYHLLIVKPPMSISTSWAYQNFNPDEVRERPDIGLMAEAAVRGDVRFIAANMRNALEQVSIKRHPIIDEIKKSMIRDGAIGSMMSGSGPSVFGIFEDAVSRASAFDKMNGQFGKCFKTDAIAKTIIGSEFVEN